MRKQRYVRALRQEYNLTFSKDICVEKKKIAVKDDFEKSWSGIEAERGGGGGVTKSRSTCVKTGLTGRENKVRLYRKQKEE